MHLKLLFYVAITTLLYGCSTTGSDSRPSLNSVAKATEGYISDNNGNILVSGDGFCYRSSAWSEANQVSVCEIKEEAIIENTDSRAAVVDDNVPTDNIALSTIPAESAPAIEKVVLNSEFAFQSEADQLSPDGDAEIDAMINKLSTFQNIKTIEIVGHTDDRGSDAYNQRLSERRATTVKNKLEQAFPQIPIFATGLGETAPVASNATAAGRQQNRRVEIRIESGDE